MLEEEREGNKEEIRKCFKCDKEGHIVKNCKEKQLIKKQKVQKESDDHTQRFYF